MSDSFFFKPYQFFLYIYARAFLYYFSFCLCQLTNVNTLYFFCFFFGGM